MSTFNITDADLKKSAQTYEKEILAMPVIAAQRTLEHMTGIPGLAGRHTLAEFSGEIELGPYNPSRVDETGVNITPRTLETFLGSVVKRFDVNEVAKTVYGELVAQGEALTTASIARQTLNYLSAKLGGSLNMAIFRGKRNESGSKTIDLFDGFDTITAAEVTASRLSAEKGNYVKLEAITEQNVYDLVNSIYDNADDCLREVPSKMYLHYNIYQLYNKRAEAVQGNVQYNKEYTKRTITTSDGLCELVPLAAKKGSKYIHLSTKKNMVYGYGAGLPDETITIEKYHEFFLSFVATLYFGVQFRSLSKETLRVAELTL